MKPIPYLSFESIHNPIKEELEDAARHVINSNWYILGKEVQSFEREYSDFVGVKNGIGVNSGLDGLIIALKACDIGPGDEVLVASNAYIACWNAIHAVGAKIVPVEPDIDTFNIDPDLIEQHINNNTKAIMAVHLFGCLCDMDHILEIAEKHDLKVIEDNAQAQGSQWQSKRSSSMGHINSTSFYPGKNLGALGDAGIITTDDKKMADKCRSLRNYGSSKKYVNDYIGMNSRLDEMQAALLSVKLKHLDNWNKERIQIAITYFNELVNIPELKLPEKRKDGSHVYHIFCIRTELRDELQKHLLSSGIQTLIHYPTPPHLQMAYSFLAYNQDEFPIARKMAKTSLSLPIYPGLTEEQIHFICDKIKVFFAKK